MEETVTPVPQNPLQQIPPVTPPIQPPKGKKPMVLMIVIHLIAVAVVGYFVYQNIQLKKQIYLPQPTPLALITPTALPTTDATANWKTYTNKTFSIKLPTQFDYDAKYSTDSSNMHFTWSEPKNATPIKSINMEFGYMQGDPILMSCKTDEECYQGYAKSFSVSGYKEISTTINAKKVKGFETSSNTSNVLIYQNFYPVSLNGKLFTFDIQMSAPTLEQAKQLVPQVNQILSTFKFTQ